MGYTLTPTFDDRDAAILESRQQAFDDRPGIRTGDFVQFPDGHIERVSHHWDDSVQTSRTGEGRWYLSRDGYMSYSGSLNRAIPIDAMRYEGQSLGEVWFFHHGLWQAHNGVTATIRCRLYRYEPKS